MFEGVDVALVDEVVELPDELTEELVAPEEVCDVEDTVLELTELTAEEEASPVMSLAPQIAEALFASPSVFFK